MNGAITIFKALANPARLRIVELLIEGERCVCEILPALHLAQPTVSLHLSALEQGGIIRSRKEGRKVYYSLIEPKVEKMISIARDMNTEQVIL